MLPNILQVLPSTVPLLLALLVNAQADHSSEASEAAISDPDQECEPYTYPPVADQMGSFPTVWQVPSILANDSNALAMWNSISSNIPTSISTHINSRFQTQPPPSDYPSDDPDCWWTYNQCVTPKLAGVSPDISDAPEPSTLGYGFDDGPQCTHNVFYDFLRDQNQKATFYYIGSNVAKFPLEAQRGLDEGHEICVHTWSHPYMTTLSSENAFAELWYTVRLCTIYCQDMAVGVTPTCWRPPFGDVDDRIRAIANALGLQTILWKYDSEDADINNSTITYDTVDNNYNNFIQTANSGTFDSTGAIILTHEVNNFTMSEAVKYYPQLKSAFKYIVPVGVALNKTQPYVETNYSLPTFEEYISGTVTTTGTSTLNSTSAMPSTSTSSSSRSSSSVTSSNSNSSGASASSTNGAAKAMSGINLAASFIIVLSFRAYLF
ncbi:carbohydrate esterase family 4 protein [Lentinula raphanica]|nr:carbohydrate esterase family 4 protein [Lentinula raphanica]